MSTTTTTPLPSLSLSQVEGPYPNTPPQPTGPIPYASIARTPIHWLWPSRIPRGKSPSSSATPASVNPSSPSTSPPASPAAPHSPTPLSPQSSVLAPQSSPSAPQQSRATPSPESPSQSSVLTPQSSLLLTAEDDPSDTIRPRLDALNANLAHIHHLRGITSLVPTDDPSDNPLAQLEDAINSIPNLALIIIDPITSFLGYTDRVISRNQTVLSALADLAARYNLAIILTSRLNKSIPDAAQPFYRAVGSLAFASAARAIHLIVPAPPSAPASVKCSLASDGTQCVFIMPPDFDSPPANFLIVPIKLSLAQKPRPLSFQIADSKIQWLPGTPSISSANADLQEAAHWLYSALAAGPVASNTIHHQAKQNGISTRSLKSAQQYLHAECTNDGFQGHWFWRLRGDTRPPSDLTDRFLLNQASLLQDLYSTTNAPSKSQSASSAPA